MTDDMKDNNAAEYVLGLLDADEARAFEDAMARDPVLREAYAFWAENLTDLTGDIADVAPPARVYANIESTLFAADVTKTGWLARIRRLPIFGAGVVAALVLAWVAFGSLTAPVANWAYKGQIASVDASLVFNAKCDPQSRILQLDRIAGAAREGRVLQLWLVTEGNAPQSIGVLDDDAVFRTELPQEMLKALWSGSLAVSDEPVGGSPADGPTGEVLAIGQVTKV